MLCTNSPQTRHRLVTQPINLEKASPHKYNPRKIYLNYKTEHNINNIHDKYIIKKLQKVI